MSLVDNTSNISFTTRWPTDKIVGVWEGSFNRATDVVKRSGSFGDIYVYRLPHGFTRPVFTDLLWSDDGVTWVDGGVGANSSSDTSLSFSDATYNYIIGSLFVPAVGTRYYKVIGFWIDSFDNTNPLVPRYTSANKDTVFDSRVNYQKIYLQDVVPFTSATTIPVTHELNRLANFRVFFEAFPGEVWPMNFGGASNPFLYDSAQTECHSVMSANALQIRLDTVPSTRRAWYRIYLDTA